MDRVHTEALLEHAGWLRGLARALVDESSAAEDLVQETWLRAIERPPRAERGLRTWLAAVTRTVAWKGRRSDRRRERRELRAGSPSPAPDPADLAERAELHRRLVDRVLALEEPARSIVLMRYFEGMRPREIALRTGVPDSTVRSRLRRALAGLRERLDEETPGGRAAWSLALLPLGHAGSAASGAAALGGGALVSTKTTIAIAGAVLILLAVGAWRLAVSPEPPGSAAEEARGTRPPGEARAVVGEDEAGPGERSADGGAEESPLRGSAAGATRERVSPPPTAGVVAGRVETGAGIRPDLARVVLVHIDPEGRTRDLEVGVSEDGTFRTEGLEPGRYVLRVSHPERAPHTSVFNLLPDRGAGPLVIVLEEGGALEVAVLDELGQPVEGDSVHVRDVGGEQAASGTTGSDGRFRVEHLVPGSYEIGWRAPGVVVQRTVRVEPEGTKEIVLHRGASFEGIVLAPDGALLEAAIVQIRATERRRGHTEHMATTDEAGRFRIRGVTPGAYSIHVHVHPRPPRPGYECHVGDVRLAVGDRVERTLRVVSTSITGRVFREDDGTPLSPRQILISANRLLSGEGEEIRVAPGAPIAAFADADGRFSFVGVEPGRYRIRVDSLQGLRPEVRDVEVPGEGVRDLEIGLRARRYGTLRVRILLPDGSPASDVGFSLVVRREGGRVGGRSLRGFDRGDGVYEVSLEEGRREVGLSRLRHRAEPEMLVLDVEGEEILERSVRLIPTGEVHLAVTMPDGSAPTRITVEVEGADGRRRRLSPYSLGAGRFRVFPDPGEVTLRVRSDAGASGEVSLSVDRVGVTEARVTLRLR